MSYRLCGVLIVGLAAQTLGTAATEAQESPTSARPRFIATWVPAGQPADASEAAVLQRQVSLELSDVPLSVALREITSQARVELSYNKSVLPAERRVSLRVQEITVVAALTEVLLNSGLDVAVARTGQLALVPRPRPPAPGTIVGRVTDAKTGSGLAGADVWLEGMRRRTAADENGYYRLAEVDAGSYTLAVRRIGYGKRVRPVTVVAAQEVTLDVALDPVPTALTDVVVTPTGDQRLLELGHVVGRINADSLMREAPVTTVTELLTARVPGLVVNQHQGTVGGDVQLQIRSASSLYLSNEPIIIVDGIRYTSNPRGGPIEPNSSGIGGVGLLGTEAPSRLNDLNPHDIESIEVVKGPSAATLYGTDAANGVIVITTKRGQAGPARWNVYATSDVREPPGRVRYRDVWWGWRSTGGVPSPASPCSLQQVAQGACVQDSISVLPHPFNSSASSIFGAKPSWGYGASVAGGRGDLRYSLSVGLTDATGPIQLPVAVLDSMKAARGVSELPVELRKPNTSSNLSLRGAVTASVSSRAEAQVNASYTRGTTRGLLSYHVYDGPYLQTPANPHFGGMGPDQGFSEASTEWINRFTGSTGLTWRPWSWLQARGTVGLDLAQDRRYSLVRASEAGGVTTLGRVGEDRTRQVNTSADLGLTASVRRGRLSSRTSFGAQYTRTLYDLLAGVGEGLPPGGGSSLLDAATRFAYQQYNERVTFGSYVEQVLGLNDRLFLTGALRMDGASGFGRDYDVAVYPKASISWLLSDEPFVPRLPGLDELRLRYAFGASGKQAEAIWARPQFGTYDRYVDGIVGPGLTLDHYGNPDLRPERVREHEFGLDAAALERRLQLDLTWNYRRTLDQIITTRLPESFGAYAGDAGFYTNLGRIDGHGFEARLTVRPLETRLVSWDVTLQHSWQDNLVIDLGSEPSNKSRGGGWVEGYPLLARFDRPFLGYADANGDGIIEAGEVQVGDSMVYVGRTVVPRTQTLGTTLALFQRRLRISALLDRHSGAVNYDDAWLTQCVFRRCREVVDPSTPLAQQARAVGARFAAPMSSTDVTTLREIAVALDLPLGLQHFLRLRNASVSVAARNLAQWTSFKDFDPETNVAGRIPIPRAWAFRFNAGF